MTLNYEKIKEHPERITKMKPFIAKYNWEGIKYQSEKDDWKKSEKSSLTNALNVLSAKNDKIYSAFVSKQNSNHKEQVFLLMIPNRMMALHCN